MRQMIFTQSLGEKMILSVLFVALGSLASEKMKFIPVDGTCKDSATKQHGFNDEFGPCGNLSEKNYSFVSLKGHDIRSSQLRRAVLVGIKLEKVQLEGADLSEARLEGAHCFLSTLRGAKLIGIVAPRSYWEACDLGRAQLQGAKLWRAQFSQSILIQANLNSAFLAYASLRGTDLRGADLRNVILLQTDFRGALFDDETQLPFSLREALQRGMIKK